MNRWKPGLPLFDEAVAAARRAQLDGKVLLWHFCFRDGRERPGMIRLSDRRSVHYSAACVCDPPIAENPATWCERCCAGLGRPQHHRVDFLDPGDKQAQRFKDEVRYCLEAEATAKEPRR